MAVNGAGSCPPISSGFSTGGKGSTSAGMTGRAPSPTAMVANQVGVQAGHVQPDQAAPVLDEEVDVAQAELVDEALQPIV